MIEATIGMLGRKAKDRVTGFEGVVTSVSFDLFGCVQAVLQPELGKDGEMAKGHWFDTNRLELKAGQAVMPVPDFAASATPAQHKHGPAEKPARARIAGC